MPTTRAHTTPAARGCGRAPAPIPMPADQRMALLRLSGVSPTSRGSIENILATAVHSPPLITADTVVDFDAALFTRWRREPDGLLSAEELINGTREDLQRLHAALGDGAAARGYCFALIDWQS